MSGLREQFLLLRARREAIDREQTRLFEGMRGTEPALFDRALSNLEADRDRLEEDLRALRANLSGPMIDWLPLEGGDIGYAPSGLWFAVGPDTDSRHEEVGWRLKRCTHQNPGAWTLEGVFPDREQARAAASRLLAALSGEVSDG